MVFELIQEDNILNLLSATEIEMAQLALTFERESPNARWDPRVKKGLWSGKINYLKRGRYLPSGLWGELIDMCKQYNFPLEIKGIERKFDNSIKFEDFNTWVETSFKNSERQPREYQIKTAYDIIRYKSCLAELATSAGKTLIVYMIIAYLLESQKSKKILVIVPTVDLVVQSNDDFHEYNQSALKIKLDIQQIYSGSVIRANSNIVIGTFQSLCKKTQEYFDEFDTVIADECLHPDTLVTMSDYTQKMIKNVNIGDKVLTTNDNTLEIEICEVDYVYKNLTTTDKLYVVELEDGTVIKLTGNHKVKLLDGTYKRTDLLTIEDEILYI